jgi:hypothetical protein
MSRITISALIHLINQENFAGSPCISVEKSSVERSNNRGMLMSVFHDWLLRIASDNYFLYIKRLSANDTGATGGHQVGLYISSDIAEKLLPSINNTQEQNPSVYLTAHVSSHEYPEIEARAIYYNNRFFGGTRNERRITRWGRGSPLQDPENTGALTLLAFKPDEHGGDSSELDIWVCVNPDEEDIIESVIGEIIPGHLYLGHPVKSWGAVTATCTSEP